MKIEIGKVRVDIAIYESMFALSFFGAAVTMAIFIVFDWTEAVCASPSGDTSKPLAQGIIACAEFWINRYQTFLGALATVGAAIYAGRWVRKQIEKTEKQIEFSRAQLSGDFVQALDIRCAKIKELLAHIDGLSAQFKSGQAQFQKLIDDGRTHFAPEKADSPDEEWHSNGRQLNGQIIAVQHKLINVQNAIESAKLSANPDGISIGLIDKYRSALFRANALCRHYMYTQEMIQFVIYGALNGIERTNADALHIFEFAKDRLADTIDETPYNVIAFGCINEQLKIMKLIDKCNKRVEALIDDVDPAMDP